MVDKRFKDLQTTVSDKVLRTYQNANAINEVFGCIIKNPDLLKDSSYKLVKEDFVTNFHKIIFTAIHDMLEADYKVTINNINKYLEDFPRDKKVYDQIDGDTFLANAAYVCDPDSFKANYDIVKKYSLFRDLVRMGIDVSEYCDPSEIMEDRIERRNRLIKETPIEDIVAHYRNKIINASNEYVMGKEDQYVKAGSQEFLSKVEEWQKNKNWWPGFSCDMLTTLTGGMVPGRFMLGSAGSGTGKTRLSISSLAHTFASRYYDPKKKSWEYTQTRGKIPCLYIGTEMELNDEIMPLIAAYMACVSTDKIQKGTITKEEHERIIQANDYLEKESSIYLAYIPDYNIGKLENCISTYVTLYGVRAVFFDYIHPTSELTSEFVDASALPTVREDQALANVGLKLKNLARKYSIFIHAGTQTSGTEEFVKKNRDHSCIRGSKALADKADTCYIMTRVRENDEEWNKLDAIRKNMVNPKSPNLCLTVYKNRSGINDRLLWINFDYTTLRAHDCFATDRNFSLDNVDQTKMVITDDGTMTLVDDDKVINRQGLKEDEDRIREEKENIKKNRPKTIEKEDVPDLITNSPTVESDEYYVAESSPKVAKSSPKYDPFDDPDAY